MSSSQLPNRTVHDEAIPQLHRPSGSSPPQKKGQTQDPLAARLQLAGLRTCDRVAVAKIESQIRSVYDYERSVLAGVLSVSVDEPSPLDPAVEGITR